MALHRIEHNKLITAFYLAYQLFNTSASIAKMVAKGHRTHIGAHGEPPLGVNYHAEMMFTKAGGLTNYEVRLILLERIITAYRLPRRSSAPQASTPRSPSASTTRLALSRPASSQTSSSTRPAWTSSTVPSTAHAIFVTSSAAGASGTLRRWWRSGPSRVGVNLCLR